MSTVALNMIVGGGEAQEILRCMEAFEAEENFDEIVVGLTSTDPSLRETLEKYSARIKFVQHEWTSADYPHGDFAGARNAALDATESDYVMWLDSDDVCLPDDVGKFGEFVSIVKSPANSAVEVYHVPYTIIVSQSLEPETQFLRDRVFRRKSLFRWKYPVHETLCEDWGAVTMQGRIKSFAITHLPMKPTPNHSALRNVRILQHEVDCGRADRRQLYFLGRDLVMAGDMQRGEKILAEFVNGFDGTAYDYENCFAACMDLVFIKGFGQFQLRPRIDQATIAGRNWIEHWCRVALGFTKKYSEPYVLLGDVYLAAGRASEAETLYKTALQKTIGNGALQAMPYYEELPAFRLSQLYFAHNECDKAMHYNRRALVHNYSNAEYWAQRARIMSVLEEELHSFKL